MAKNDEALVLARRLRENSDVARTGEAAEIVDELISVLSA